MGQVEDVAKPKAAYMVNSYLDWAQTIEVSSSKTAITVRKLRAVT